VAPVDLEALAGARLHAQKGTPGDGVEADRAQIVLEDGEAALITQGSQALGDDHRRDGGVLLQEFGDRRLEGVELAGAGTVDRRRRGLIQVPGNGAAPEVEVAGDLAHRPVFRPVESMNGIDHVHAQHGVVISARAGWYQRAVLYKSPSEPTRED
jgi:hypothetical protein